MKASWLASAFLGGLTYVVVCCGPAEKGDDGHVQKGWDDPIMVLDCWEEPRGPWENAHDCFVAYEDAREECEACCEELDPGGYAWCWVGQCDPGFDHGVTQVCYPVD